MTIAFPYCSPDIQVGIPLSSLVDKVLESKAKELLPKITDIVEKLRETKNNHSPSTSDTSTFSQASAEKNVQETVPKVKPADFGSLPLPINIPGLNSSTSGNSVSPSVKKEQGEGKVPQKSKSKLSESFGAKENKTKAKASQQKMSITAKEDKDSVTMKDTVAEEEAKDKERDKHKPAPKQKKTRDEGKDKDKGTNMHKDKSQEGKVTVTEKLDRESNLSKSGNKVGKGLPVVQQEQPSDTKKDSVTTKTECPEIEVQSESKKVLPQRRRSARIASLSESVEDTKEERDSDEQHGVEEKSSERETVDRTVSEGVVKAKSNGSGSLTKRKRKRQVKSESQKKRQRLLSSSSDEELEIVSSEEESDQGSVEEVTKSNTKRKSIHVDSQAQTVKRSRKRAHQHIPNEGTDLLIAHKKPRKVSKNTTDSSITQALPSSEPVRCEENVQKVHRRKSSQPQRLPQRASKSPPSAIVITRYNRQIKPNRRYLENSGETNEAGSELEDEPVEDKQSTHDPRDMEYSDIDTDSEESGQEN